MDQAASAAAATTTATAASAPSTTAAAGRVGQRNNTHRTVNVHGRLMYDEIVINDVWINAILSTLALTCAACLCLCFLYCKFQQWKHAGKTSCGGGGGVGAGVSQTAGGEKFFLNHIDSKKCTLFFKHFFDPEVLKGSSTTGLNDPTTSVFFFGRRRNLGWVQFVSKIG